MSDRATLANTIRALELLADSHTAHEAGDNERCDALVRQLAADYETDANAITARENA